jgi:REP element-mobilizing transposase RayT
MSTICPVYEPDSCRAAYQLNWSLTLFWSNKTPPPADQWLVALRKSLEPAGVRILEHQFTETPISQFLLSTTPDISASNIVRNVKGRLQHQFRRLSAKFFRRNYSIHSLGSASATAVQHYVARQVTHHRMADPRTEERLRKFQYFDPEVDLAQVRRSSYGEFIINLHLVLNNRDQLPNLSNEWLQTNYEMFPRIAKSKGHMLSRVGVAANHFHVTLGASVRESPAEVAMSYLNNLAYAHGSKRVFQAGFYVGTFGRYDLAVVRRNLARSKSASSSKRV